MPRRVRPPVDSDEHAVLEVIHARDVAPDEAEVHRVVQDAFAEIEGHREQTLDQWRSKGIATEGHDPSLWLLLEDDEGIAGVALGERWEDGTGYVAELAGMRTVWQAERWEKALGSG